MKLEIPQWQEFEVRAIFEIRNGRGITSEEVEENPGTLNAVQSGEENNGVLGRINEQYCREMGYIYTRKKCLTVARTGSAGFVSFQANGCVVGDSAKLLLLKKADTTAEIYLFLQTILSQNRFKYSYGRKVTEKKYMQDVIDLPIQLDINGQPVVDDAASYHPSGYVPDWTFMEDFIRSLHYRRITTENTGTPRQLGTSSWQFFFLKDLCSIDMGNKMDFSAMPTDNPKVNFVGRSAENNGVMGQVDLVAGVSPYPAAALTVALGGSLGSTFLQDEPFYTSQNVSVLQFSNVVSTYARLFIASMIQFESRFKYFPFGRELNKYIRTIFGFDLPSKRDEHGEPVIDPTKQYHEDGYVPDWQFMEDYIKSLPYGDRIPEIVPQGEGGD